MTRPRIKVAYILTPVSFGGAEQVSLNFLRTVDRGRFDITPILFIRPWEDETYFARELHEIGYTFEAMPVSVDTAYDPVRVPRVTYMVLCCLKKNGCQLVHTNGYFADICGQPVARLLGISGIATCHGFISEDWKLRFYNRLDKFALRLCRHVIAVSEKIKEDLVKSGIRRSRISVIPNGVPLVPVEGNAALRRRELRSLMDIGPEEHAIGYLGRLSPEKGLIYLIEAVSQLFNSTMRLKLIIVGDGPERAKLERKVKGAGLESKIVFAGFQTETEEWYRIFDSFVLPSLTEGTPLALLEAMAAGLPVVASAVGGVPKVVSDGINGLLSPPGDAAALRDKIRVLIENPILSRMIGKKGAQSVRAEYGIDRWCQAIEDCYSGL